MVAGATFMVVAVGCLTMADDDVLTFDLNEWPPDMLEALELMLRGRSIAFEWDPPGVLNVGSWHEHEVDDFLDYLEAEPAGQPRPSRRSHERGPMSVGDFYEGDPARQESEEVDFGHGWTDGGGDRYDLSWVRDTGELTLMRASSRPTIEVLATLATLDEVEDVLDGWVDMMLHSNSVQWVRRRVASGPPRPSRPARPEPATSDEVWVIPAAVGWIAGEMDLVFAAYETLRDTLGPDRALERALVTALDRDSWERLQEFFAGEKDVVYGDGAGERARVEIRQALEERLAPT